MKTNNSFWHDSFLAAALTFAAACLYFAPGALGQQKPAPTGGSTSTDKFPAAKAKAQTPAQSPADAAADTDEDAQSKPDNEEKDSPEAIRKREEWFYKQRASVNGHIPGGARLKALQHMQRMMAAEGKLVQRPDGSYAEVAPQTGSSTFPAWSSIGPTPTTGGVFSPVTGRITTIAVDPSDSTGNTLLIGGAQGGIWRSTDAGVTWKAVGDQNASLAMGSVAFAPSSPATVYAGTGEQASIGFDIYYGAGVLKSTDHGQTWTQTCTVAGPTCPFIGPYLDSLNPSFGFFNFGGARISYVAVNPGNPNLILVGAQFLVEGPQEGVYCSSNGGASWTNILPDEMATFVGFASSSVAFVALGNPFGSSPGAPHGNGIYKSINATTCSATFTPVTAGLPSQPSLGRMDLGISPNYASDNTAYASIADASTSSTSSLGVWVTTNGGTLWTQQTSAPDVCSGQCWYDDVIKVDPNNKNFAFFGGSSLTDSSGNPMWVVRTTNGGTSWSTVLPSQPGPGLPHVDTHALAFFKLPGGKVRLYLGNDGGIWRTDDAEASTISWTNLNDSLLTLTQFYPSISINTSSSSLAFAGTQDNGSQNYQGGVGWVDNHLCGDGASTAVDPLVPSTVYIGCATGYPINASYQNGSPGTFSPAISGISPNDYSGFIAPLATDPSTPNVVYYGTTKVYQSVDAGNSWVSVSGGDLAAGYNGDVLTTIAVDPGNPSVIYAGSSSGHIFMGGVSSGAGGFAQHPNSGSIFPQRAITAFAIDPSDATGNTAYVSISGFSFVGNDPLGNSVNDPIGHVFKTTNGGFSLIDVSCSVAVCSTPAPSDLPNIPVNDLVLDPDVPGTLYAATDLGVYVGNCTVTPCTWNTLGTGLPRVAVLSIRLHEASRTLRAATHGRGVWDNALNNFAFTGPRIFSLTPTSATAGGAQLTLTVTGTGLTGGTILFGTTPLTTAAIQPDTKLSATISSAMLVAGTPQVSVKVATTTSNTLPFAVLALTPTLSSSNPTSTPVQIPPALPANIPIQLTGTNFASSAKVLFNGSYSGIMATFNSSTGLSATLPSAILGPFGSTNDLAVINTPPGGGRSTPITFKIVAPAPANDNFANAINITSLTYSDVRDSSNATAQIGSDPTPPATCVQQLTSPQGNTGGLPNGAYNTIWYQFTPIFSSNLGVDTIGSSYDTVLSIWTGTAGSLTSIACNDDINPGIVTQSQLSSVPLTAGTTYYIMVSSFGPPDPNPTALGGKSQLNFSYNFGIYPAATLTSILPTSANSGDPDLTVTITGSGFFSGAGIQFANTSTSLANLFPTTFVSSTKLTAVIPASAMALPGSFSISVVNPNPSNGPSNALPFTVNLGTYPVPNLTSLYPATVIAGSLPFQLIAGGTQFAPGAVIDFNGVVKATTVNGATNAYATISTADISASGTVLVTVNNPTPGGGPSAPLSFIITQPTVVPNITSVNPSTVPAGLQTNLTVNGTGFTQGAQLNVVGPGAGFYNTNFLSSTQLSIPNFAVGGVGPYQVYVVDPAPAGTSTVFVLTATQPPPPTITSISPSSVQSGSTTTLMITGTNFQNGASVMFNGSSFGAIYTNSTQLSVQLSFSGLSAGTYTLTVVNPVPTPTPSAPANFTVTGPPDFSLAVAAGQSSQTVNAGQTATFMNVITVNAVNGFTGQVAVSCTSPAQATTCSLNQNTLTAGQSATVVVSTMARSMAPPPLNPRIISWPRLVPVMVIMLVCVLLTRLARTRRQRVLASLPLAGVLLFLVLQAVGCGGGSYQAPPPPPPTGTPAGTYTITLTGISSNPNATHTATLQLIVN